MATFRKIHTIFWSDPFVQQLSPERKYFYLYLLTNEKTRQCGIYEISKGQISYDTGYNIDTVSILLKYFIQSRKIAYSAETSEIAIKNWKKYNDNSSPKVQTLVKQELTLVKNKDLIQYIYSTDTVSIRYPQEEEEREEEVEKEKEGDTTSQFQCFDIEKYLKANRNQLETLCMNAHKSEIEVLAVAKKYHLWNQENDKYPKKPLQLIAGLHKWILNEKNITNGTNSNTSGRNSKTAGRDQLIESLRTDIESGAR